MHPVIETVSERQENANPVQLDETYVDIEATPTSDTHHSNTNALEIVTSKSSSNKYRRAEQPLFASNPFKEISKHSDREYTEYTESLPLSGKISRASRNPFEKLTKRSGKVIEDADDLEEYVSQDVSSVSSSPNYNRGKEQSRSNIGTWTAGVMGGSSSKLQAIQKWFKSESFDSRDSKRGDFTELASVSVRDLVKAMGGISNDGKFNCYSPHQLSQSSSPVSIPFSKLHVEFHFSVRSEMLQDIFCP